MKLEGFGASRSKEPKLGRTLIAVTYKSLALLAGVRQETAVSANHPRMVGCFPGLFPFPSFNFSISQLFNV
jgi:hypothetical protein